MTRGPVGRRGAAVLDLVRRRDAGTILTLLLVGGLLLRVFVGGIYMPLSGFGIDIRDFAAWGQRLASLGPADFYEPGYFGDYPPGYLYVLWLLGLIGAALGSVIGQDATQALVKIPGTLADLGVAAMVFVICRRWGRQILAHAGGARIGPSGETLGLAAATVYLFNPGTVFNSAVWGQIDSVGTLVLLAAIYLLGRGWTEAAAVIAVVAMLVKFQFAFLIPIVAVVGLKRHLFGRSSDPAHHGARQPLRVLTSLGAALAALLLLMLPFEMTLYAPLPGGDPRGLLGILPEADPVRSLVGKFVEAATLYTGLSINAFNLWRNSWSGLGDTLFWGDDRAVGLVFGSVALTWQQVGAIVFVLPAVLALWQVARRDDMRGILLASLVLAIAFFALPTRVHERYLFPAVALAAPFVLRNWGWALIYGALSFAFFMNLYWVYSSDWSFAGMGVLNPGRDGAPMPRDPLLDVTLFTDGGIYVLSAAVVLLAAAVGSLSLRLALRPAREPAPMMAAEAAPQPPQARQPVAEEWAPSGAESEQRPGSRWATLVGSRLAWLRPDPADPLLREPSRRLDRWDAALLIGLVLFALLFRLWRLDVPRGMHFDEVYHARSAAEWLANWQNGWGRDVYEWTHPMLAKYLIAAGIVVADPNRLLDEAQLDGPAPSLVVAPARSSEGRSRSLAFTAAQDLITARDAVSGEELARWRAGGQVATLAFDETALRLLVGRGDAGSIETFDMAAFLSVQGERAPPLAGPSIPSGLDAVTQLLLPETGATIVARGPVGLAVLDRLGAQPPVTTDVATASIGWLPAYSNSQLPERVVASVPERNAIAFLDAATLLPVQADVGSEVPLTEPLVGPILTRGSGDDQQVFALTGPLAADEEHPATAGGLAVIDGDGQRLIDGAPLPGAADAIGWQPVANILYVAGSDAAGLPVLWTVEPHGESRRETSAGFAVFDVTPLPGQALALAFDVSRHSQADDHGGLLVSTASGSSASLVTVDAGSNAFAWRLSGVVFGSILVGLIYLLAATMFSRRRVAVLAAAFVAIDGMSVVMSRISMNDIFAAAFIVAAYLVFWQIWSGRWRRSAWWALPAVGVLIGLAAASKWVGFYALAGLWVLVLARSALGRLLLVGLVAFAAVVGGLGAPWPFLVVMAGLTALALVLVYRRPIRVEIDDLRLALPATGLVLGGIGLAFAVAHPTVAGRDPRSAVELVFSYLTRGAEAGWPGLLMLGAAAVLLAWRAVASLRDPASDARWWRPAEMGGFAWSWVGACLLVVPLAVYALTYLPYLQLGHSFAIPNTGPGYGWSLDELHSQMFGYHFGLTASHASSSPWWSWPLDLKPTWFFSADYDGRQTAVIYNGGNPLLFWAGLPAVVAGAVLAWKRQSPALVLLVVAFAFQFLPWTRIERATFAYHYLTAVVFAMVAIAYLVDEVLRRPAWRDLAVGYLALVALAALLIFPLGSAFPMPDWYITAARALPPWNYAFQFPPPPQGQRGELLALSAPLLALGGVAAAASVAFALRGRRWWERRRASGRMAEPVEG